MILFVIAALISYLVKGLCGFANTLVFSSILSFSVDNIAISPVDLILGFPANVVLTWRNRRKLKWKIWAPVAILVLLGSIPGIFLLQKGGAKLIKVLFGAAVIVIGIEMLYHEYSREKTNKAGAPEATRGDKILLTLIGPISGVLCGLYGVAALLAVYMRRVTDNDSSFKANMCAVLVTENIFRIMVYWATGILSLQSVRQAVLLAPAMLAGLWFGIKCSDRLNESAVKKVIIIMLLLSGASLIAANLS